LVDWLNYYQQPYVLASLNQFVSNIDHEIWRKSGSNTNNAEAAHSMVNRDGKQLNLLSAILRYIFFNNFIRLLYNIIISLLNKIIFIFTFKEEKNLMNDVIKQLKFIIKQVFLILIGIEVKSKGCKNQ